MNIRKAMRHLEAGKAVQLGEGPGSKVLSAIPSKTNLGDPFHWLKIRHANGEEVALAGLTTADLASSEWRLWEPPSGAPRAGCGGIGQAMDWMFDGYPAFRMAWGGAETGKLAEIRGGRFVLTGFEGKSLSDEDLLATDWMRGRKHVEISASPIQDGAIKVDPDRLGPGLDGPAEADDPSVGGIGRAVRWLKAGKPVRRQAWEPGRYLTMCDGGEGITIHEPGAINKTLYGRLDWAYVEDIVAWDWIIGSGR